MSDQVLVSNRSSADWNTMVERISIEIARQAPDDYDNIKRAVCDAIKHFRSRRYRFNQGSATLSTIAGQEAYDVETVAGQGDGYPADIMILDRVEGNFANSTQKIPYKTHSEYLQEKTHVSEQGYPDFYTFYKDQFILYPKPSSVHTITLSYLADIGTPFYAYVNDEWNFYEPDGSVINNNFTSPWFDEAEGLIRAQAKWELYANVYNDFTNAQAQVSVIAHNDRALRREFRGVTPFQVKAWQ